MGFNIRIPKIFYSIKSRFAAVFIVLTLVPLLFSFFFAVNTIIEIVERTLSRNLDRINSDYVSKLTSYPKAKLICDIVNGDDDLKIKMFLNMKNQTAGKIEMIFSENNISAIAAVNNSDSINIYFHKKGEYLDNFDSKVLKSAMRGGQRSGINKINGACYSYSYFPLTDKQSAYTLGALAIIYKIDSQFLDEIILDTNSIILFFDMKDNKIFAQSSKFKHDIDGKEIMRIYEKDISKDHILDGNLVRFNKIDDDILLITGVNRSESKYIVWLTIRRFIVVSFILIAAGILLGFATARRIIKPVTQLTEVIKENIEQQRLTPVDFDHRSRDEVHILMDLFNKMVKRLNETREHLLRTSKLASIGQLAAGISHEINNPLVTILGYTQMMIEKTDPASKTYKYLKIIEDDAKRCKNTISRLLTFSRPSDNKIECFDIHLLIKEVISLFEIEISKNCISVSLDNKIQDPYISADIGQLKQVLVNLFLNAIYSLKNSGKLLKCIKIEISENEKNVVISVFDNGCGIKSENIDKIFDPYFTTKKLGEGTGLGLSISYSIVKLFAGTIEIESRENEFAEFIMKFEKKERNSNSSSEGLRK